MTRKIYRTAMGKMVDLGALTLRNENVRAVGNMGVNARGDILDSTNNPIDTRNQQVARQYQRQTTSEANVINPSRPRHVQRQQRAGSPPAIPAPPEDFEDDFIKEPENSTAQSASGGLAAAIARAREVKQQPMKTPREIAQEKGPNKI